MFSSNHRSTVTMAALGMLFAIAMATSDPDRHAEQSEITPKTAATAMQWAPGGFVEEKPKVDQTSVDMERDYGETPVDSDFLPVDDPDLLAEAILM